MSHLTDKEQRNYILSLIDRTKEYREKVENLYSVVGKSKEGDSLLEDINFRLEILEKEFKTYTLPSFNGDTQEKVSDNKSNETENEGEKYPHDVLFSFIENPEYNADFQGKVFEFISNYLDEKGIKFTCERDTQDMVDGEMKSYLKFNFVKDFEDGPALVRILCSEYSSEMYVFINSYMVYPITVDFARKNAECIQIGRKLNSKAKSKIKKELRALLQIEEQDTEVKESHIEEKSVKISETEKAETLFKERFPEVDSRVFLPFALLHSLMTFDEDLFNDLFTNFRPLIDNSCFIKIPKFHSINSDYSIGVLYENGTLPMSLGVNKDADLLNAFYKYSSFLHMNSQFEINKKEYSIVLDELPLYHLGLYCFCCLDENYYKENENIVKFYDKLSNLLYENINDKSVSKSSSEIFMVLVNHAMKIGRPEILFVAEKHNIGFHSGKDIDIDELVLHTLNFMVSFIDDKEVFEGNQKKTQQRTEGIELDDETIKNRFNTFKFIIKNCGSDIYNRLSKNSSRNYSFFSNKISEWIKLCEMLYSNNPKTENSDGSIIENMNKLLLEIRANLKFNYKKRIAYLH